MFGLSDEEAGAWSSAVRGAATRTEVVRFVASVYDDFGQELESYARDAPAPPACGVSGACCRFEAYGHRLFVTTLELAAFVASRSVASSVPARAGHPDPSWDGSGCPYQSLGRCSVHAARPFGCRVYFCDASTRDWQHAVYERLHERLRTGHERLGVPYRYVEWRVALRACGLASADDRSGRSLPVLASGSTL